MCSAFSCCSQCSARHAGRLSAPTERDDSAALGPPEGAHSARRSANKTPAGAPRRRPSHLNPAGGGGGEGVGRMQMQLLDGEKEGGGVLKTSGPVEEHKLLPLAVSPVGVFT